MTSDIEQLDSWAVEIDNSDRPSLVLVLNGRGVGIPPLTADLLGRALRERALELTNKGGRDGPANQP